MKLIFYTLLISSTLLFSACNQQFIGLFNRGSYTPKNNVEELNFSFENGLIIVPVQIGNNSYRFLLDTGAPNLVSQELQETLNLQSRRKIKTTDSQGNSSVLDYCGIPTLLLGHAKFNNTTAAVANLKQADAIACLNIDGIIGSNLMKKAIWQIDYQQNKIFIYSKRKFIPQLDSSNILPFHTLVTGTPMISISAGNQEIKNVTFDTGSVGFLSLHKEVYSSFNKSKTILNERKTFGSNTVGLFGTAAKDTIRHILLDELTIGNIHLKHPVVEIQNEKKALLGNSFLKNYIVTIDWQTSKIFLTQQGQINNDYTNSFGFTIIREGDKMVISSITESSSAQQQGIEIGDEVLRVNSVELSPATLENYCTYIKEVRVRKDLDELIITIMKDGIPKDYTLVKLPVMEAIQ